MKSKVKDAYLSKMYNKPTQFSLTDEVNPFKTEDAGSDSYVMPVDQMYSLTQGAKPEIDWMTKSLQPVEGQPTPETPSTPEKSSFSEEDASVGAASAAAKGASKEDIVAAGLMASKNPYAIGAGLALMAYSGAQKERMERARQKYLAKLQQARANQQAIQNLSEIGARLKV